MANVDVEGGGKKAVPYYIAKPPPAPPPPPAPYYIAKPGGPSQPFAPPPGALLDRLGHYWNEHTQQWHNVNDGSPYVEPAPYYIAKPGGPSQPAPNAPPYYVAKPGGPSQSIPQPVNKVQKAPSGGFVGGVLDKVQKLPRQVVDVAQDVRGAAMDYSENYNESVQSGINKLPSPAAAVVRGITGQPKPGGEIANPLQSALPESAIQTAASPLGMIPGPTGDVAEQFGQNLIRNVTSPAGVAGLAVGGPIANIAAEVGAAGAQTVTDHTNLPPWVEMPLVVGAGIVGGAAGGGVRPRPGAVDDFVPTPGLRRPVAPDIVPPTGSLTPPPIARAPALDPADVFTPPPAAVAPPVVPVARQIDDILSPTGTRVPEPAASYATPRGRELAQQGLFDGDEFRAEIEAGLAAGETYPDYVMNLYRSLPPKPPAPVVPRVVGPGRQAFNGEITQGGTVRPADVAAGGAASVPPSSAVPPVSPRVEGPFGSNSPVQAGHWRLYFEDPADRAAYLAKDPAIRQVVKDTPIDGTTNPRGPGDKTIPSQAAQAIQPTTAPVTSGPSIPASSARAADVPPAGRVPDVEVGDGHISPPPPKTPLEGGLNEIEQALAASILNVKMGRNVRYVEPHVSGTRADLPPRQMVVDTRTGEILSTGTPLDARKRPKGLVQVANPDGSRRVGQKPGVPREHLRPATDEEIASVSPPEPAPPAIPDLANNPVYQAAASRAVMDNLNVDEVAALERMETRAREAIGLNGIEETLPPGYVSPWEPPSISAYESARGLKTYRPDPFPVEKVPAPMQADLRLLPEQDLRLLEDVRWLDERTATEHSRTASALAQGGPVSPESLEGVVKGHGTVLVRDPRHVVHEVGHVVTEKYSHTLDDGLPDIFRRADETTVDYINRVPESEWPPTVYGLNRSGEDLADSYVLYRLEGKVPDAEIARRLGGEAPARPLSPGRRAFFQGMDRWTGASPVAAAVPEPMGMADIENLLMGAWEAGATPEQIARRLDTVKAVTRSNPDLHAQVAAIEAKLRGLGIKTKPDNFTTRANRSKALQKADDAIVKQFEDLREAHPRKIDIDVDTLENLLVAAKRAGVPDDRIRYRLATARRAAGGSLGAKARIDALETKLGGIPAVMRPDWAADPAVFDVLNQADVLLKEVPAGGFRVPQKPRVAPLVEPTRPPTRMERVKGKLGAGIVQVVNIPRTSKANFDGSFVRRQGGPLNVGVAFFNPKAAIRQWTQTAGAGIRGMSPAQAEAQQARILAKPRSTKLYIAPLDGAAPMNLREEAMLGNVITKGKYNPLRVTSNANTVYLNTQRAMFYDMIVDGWAAAGKKATPGELDFVANFINHATGRGGIEWLNNAMPALSVGMFSPRYTLSRFQLLADPFLAPTWRTRWMATRVAGANLAMQAATAVAIGSLLKVAGVDYEMDPRSTDFGRVRWKTPVGTAVIDTTAGLNAPIRFVTQLATGSYKSSTGAIKERSQQETIARFLRSKASPIGGEVMDWFFNEMGLSDLSFENKPGGLGDLPGVRDIPYANEIANMVAPITLDNAVRYFSMANSPSTYATAAGLLVGELFGDSNSYRNLSAWELRDQEIVDDPEFAQYKRHDVDGPIKGYDDLNEAGKLLARRKYPVEAFSSAGQLRAEQKKNAEQRRADRLLGVEDILRNSRDPSYGGPHQYSGSGLNGPGRQARDAVRDIQKQFAAELDVIYENAPDSLPSVVNNWRLQVEANTWPDGQRVDWDAVEAWEATLSPAERDELEQYFAVSAAGKTGIVKEISDASRAIGDSGFWDTHDAAWSSVKDSGQFPEAGLYKDIYEYKRQWVAEHAGEFGNDKEAAAKAFDKLPVAKAFEAEKEKHVLQWVLDHPEEAKTAANWDYYEPNDDTRGYLATGDRNQIVTRQQEIEVTQTVHNTEVRTTAGTAPFIEQPKLAWKSYARNLPRVGGKAAADFDHPADYKAAGGTVPPEFSDGGDISADDYKKNPSAYIRVQGRTDKGNVTYSYISTQGKAEVEAIIALHRQNPRAVEDAFRLGIPGFKTGEGGTINATEVAYLKSQGVNIP